jgi:predicted porin
VVNGGLNSAAQVFVTEIEVLAELTSEQSISRIHRTHLADATAHYAFSEELGARASVSWQEEPAQGAEGERRTVSYLLGTRYQQTPALEHDLRWEQAFQSSGDEDQEDLVDQSASYALRFDPWPTLGATVGGTHRTVHADGRAQQEDNNGSVQLRGRPVRGLAFRLETSRSRNLQYTAGFRSDTWNHRLSTELTITRAIVATGSAGRQSTRSEPEERTRMRRTYGLQLELRPTRTVLVRGSFDGLDDERIDTVRHEAALIWNLAPKLTASGSASWYESSAERETRRFDTTVTYRMSPRTTLYFQSNRIDFSGAGGANTESYQVGARQSF